MLLVKTIKAQRFESEPLLRAIAIEQQSIAEKVKQDFEATTKTWKHKPKFEILTDIDAKGNVTTLVGTDDERYGWIDKGTRRRTIKPRPENKSGLLVFPSGYSPATKPGFIGSYPTGSYGPLVFTPIVKKHKIKARRFTETIAKKWKPKYRRALERVLARQTKKMMGK